MNVPRIERIWLTIGVVVLGFFLITVTATSIVDGTTPPSHIQTIDPTRVSSTPPFDHPGLHQTGPNAYDAYYVAHIFAFDPAKIVVPAGAAVTFYVTSPDVVHGFLITQTDANLMVVPGWVSTVKHTFEKPGTYLLVCHEYCGAGHALMAGQIEVH